ncbi:hypothetical protein ABCR94_29090 [Streptomyces sp. 21So2-11]|uniref:hypothetical protein n=1 Tax=Streptomyces sp. 21So2-11 TaxID=3144408 RepID=UPI00321BDF58
MTATVVAVALSLASAVAYASAAVTQQRLAARSEPSAGVLALFGRAAWWGAVGLNAGGALLHVAALSFGPLTLVQPLGALTLVAAVPLGARLAGRRVTLVELRGTVLTLLGLGALLLAAQGAAPHETLSLPEALGVAAVTMTLVTVLTRTGSRHPGLRHATASGFTSGVASALTQTVTVAAAAHGAGPLLTWRIAIVALLVAGLAAGGLLLSQTAYRGGLGGPLAMVTLANPVAAAVIGLALLGERLQGGPVGLLLALVGAAAATRGVLLLTRAPAPAAPLVTPIPAPSPAPALAPRPALSSGPAQALSRTRACVPLVRHGRPVASSSATVLAERPVTTSDFKVRSAATGPGK